MPIDRKRSEATYYDITCDRCGYQEDGFDAHESFNVVEIWPADVIPHDPDERRNQRRDKVPIEVLALCLNCMAAATTEITVHPGDK